MPDLEAEVLAEIRRILATDLEITRPVELDDELLKDLQLDSMGAIVLAVGLEDRFRVRLSAADAGATATVRDLVAVVAHRAAMENAPPRDPGGAAA